MKKEDHVTYWKEGSLHDLESAEAIFRSQKYDWCLFVGHLALEKILKAVFVDKNDNNIPPKTHNLIRLAEFSGIELNDDQKFELDTINDFSIQTRYPDYKASFYKKCNEGYAGTHLQKIKEFHAWFISLIK
jgi:HEPN domain-containing protein